MKKYRLKEVVVAITTYDPDIKDWTKSPGTKWMIEEKTWLGWSEYGYGDKLPYNEAKLKLEKLIEADIAYEEYYEKLRIELKKPMKTLYPPLPDEEPK